MSTTQLAENKELVLEFFRRLETGDVAHAFAMFSDDATWYSPSARATRTATQMEAAIGWLLTRMEDGIRFDVGLVTAEDDRVAITLESHAQLDHGKPYNNVYHFLFEITDGRFRKAWEFNDTLHVLRQLEDLEGFAEARAGAT